MSTLPLEKAVPQQEKMLFVINKGAGPKRGIDYPAEIRSYFGENENIILYIMRDDPTGKLLLDEIKKIEPDIVVAVGGDGTITYVAQVLKNSGIAMGIIPAGSANGMARELEIPIDVKEAMHIIAKKTTREIDLILMNNEYICMHLSDAGLNARLIKYFEKGNVRGKIGYLKALTKIVLKRKKMTATIESRDKEITCDAEMILIANAKKYGTGAIINPMGELNDGWFEVIIIEKMKLHHILKMFLKFTRYNSSTFRVVQAKAVKIKCKSKMHFQIDGQYLGKQKEIHARILPGALKVIVSD